MASSTEFLTSPSPKPLTDGYNSFVSNWVDKRSATCIGISIVFTGGVPVGSAQLETSNAPSQVGTAYQYPNNNGDDAATVPGSSQAIVLNTLTDNYGYQWQVSNLAARWVRVRYTASSEVAGLLVNVYASIPYESV